MEVRKHTNQYTVGWVAALPIEQAAATAMFDEEHGRPIDFRQQPSDYNSYSWGKIADHNVVVGVLPAGVTGIASAATTATHMLTAFPQIRIGLMVGIGGGIPNPDDDIDIRLGDIVVSQPSGIHGGVVQYDLGKATQGGKFERKGFLNAPPQTILAALSRLQGKHERAPSAVPDILTKMLENNPHMATMKSGFGYQGEKNDKLFKSTYPHPRGRTCAQCDVGERVSREERPSTDPVIHYGLIASSNTVVKDAMFRDTLSDKVDGECLCCEMEAAGLMNTFPCLVVRGISDYADSHKNDKWQRYAAAAAAAYAKEFLTTIVREELEGDITALDLMKNVAEGIYDIEILLTKTEKDITKMYSDKRSCDIYTWLSPPDPSANYSIALGRRHPGSGHWLLENPQFLAWKTAQSSFLWLHGKPGCGKTILSSTVIEHLRTVVSEVVVPIYFYFDFSDTTKRSFRKMAASLACQLYSQYSPTQAHLDELYSSCKSGKQVLSNTLLSRILEEMIENTGKVWIVLDALDECRSEDREHLLEWIPHLQSLKANVRLIVTSRAEQHIESSITEWAKDSEIIPIDSLLVKNDIHRYIKARVREHQGLSRWRRHPDVQMEIEFALTQKAGGMFRWVACQLDELQNCLDLPKLKETLASLPKDLADTYARILGNIPCNDSPKTIRILQLLTYSERPLRLEEVVDAIAVDVECEPHFDKRNRMPIPAEISRYCASLVAIVKKIDYDEEFTELQLAHFSVREWLMSLGQDHELGKDFHEGTARLMITTVCTTYLMDLKYVEGSQAVRTLYPFAQYCAQYWAEHAAIAESYSQTVNEGTMQLLNCRHSLEGCYRLFPPDSWQNVPHQCDLPHGLYYATCTGMLYAVEKILLNPCVDIDALGYVGTSLVAASKYGHYEIVQLLLDKGADVNAHGNSYFGTALIAASEGGHYEIVHLLLDKGADVNAQASSYFGTALIAASERGHYEIVQLLLDKGADVNAQASGYFGTALIAASERGHYEIVQLLLEKGADDNAQGSTSFGTSALKVASWEGHEGIVQLLLDKGADVNSMAQGSYNIALIAASERGHNEIVQLLLDKGADANAKRVRDFSTALMAAAEGGHGETVRLLLDRGADVNAQGRGFFGTALNAASRGGHEGIVQLLLSKGADVNAQGNRSFRTAREAATAWGHYRIVHLLEKACGNTEGRPGIKRARR